MVSKSEIFEVHLQREGQWRIDSSAHSQSEAEELAKKVLNRQGVTGVRVIKETTRGETAREQVVFEKLKSSGSSDKILIGEVDAAPLCENADALFGTDGRQILNRLFRSYLDKNGVTASEVMHEFRELRRLMDADTLIMSGVGKVAALQAKAYPGTGDVTARRDALFGFLNELSDRAREAAAKTLPTIAKDGFEATVEKIAAQSGDADCSYFVRLAIARELVQQRSYFAKLSQTVTWVAPCEIPIGRQAADIYISDTLCNSQTLQDLLGTRENLAAALGALIELAHGSFDAHAEGKPDDAPEATTGRLTGLFASGALPESRVVLVDRIRRQVEGKLPLSHEGGSDEDEALKGLIDNLMPEDVLLGGGPMAEALTHRQSRIINRGGVNGLREATGRLLPTFGDPVRKAAYLIALSESTLAETIRDEIDMQLDGLFVRPDSVKQIVRDNRPPNKKMQTVTAVFRKFQDSSLDATLKARIVNRLDELLARYITEDKILDKVDDPNRPLHVRAFMLLSMCSPDMLPEGQASKLARSIVVKHLRRKDFENELVAQVPGPEKERVLRDFHVQLYRCGFMQ
ncbi:hypothetical protein T8K17_23590 [Thalassobaculum sp. OXR-137]|uniref:hypothetical protein n=1 Tax=Thalassobaculum sp. OXR-137 TaxID=3100173 RepID=UPI002AC95EE4|nr:hypothetical protein [Thalassobaculum sp. OXR-137]WPZ34202.1 hypothetical protein T8K17_23590 [Thalassobaculum sp. OXR-137]